MNVGNSLTFDKIFVSKSGCTFFPDTMYDVSDVHVAGKILLLIERLTGTKLSLFGFEKPAYSIISTAYHGVILDRNGVWKNNIKANTWRHILTKAIMGSDHDRLIIFGDDDAFEDIDISNARRWHGKTNRIPDISDLTSLLTTDNLYVVRRTARSAIEHISVNENDIPHDYVLGMLQGVYEVEKVHIDDDKKII